MSFGTIPRDRADSTTKRSTRSQTMCGLDKLLTFCFWTLTWNRSKSLRDARFALDASFFDHVVSAHLAAMPDLVMA